MTERPTGRPEPSRSDRARRALALAGACLAAAAGLGSAWAARPPVTLVVCAPGYPGSTAEAQPAMDAFAAAVAAAAGWQPGELTAVYHETEQAGLARLAAPDAALALVPLPFWLQHREALGLAPHLQAVQQGGEAAEAWSLVVASGRRRAAGRPRRLRDPLARRLRAALRPRSRPRVVGRAAARRSTITFSPAVLTGLRKASGGAKVAVLLDSAQAAALPTLPYAAKLKVVARSRPLPVSVLCTVGRRMPAARLAALVKALTSLGAHAGGAEALAGVRMARFVTADQQALAAARAAFDRVKE